MIMLLFVLLIPFMCLSQDKKEPHLALTKVFQNSTLSLPMRLLANADYAKKCALKKQNALVPNVLSYKSRKPAQLLLTYEKLPEIAHVPNLPEMQIIENFTIKAELKSLPQNLECGMRKSKSASPKKNEIQQLVPKKQSIHVAEAKNLESKFRFIDTLDNTIFDISLNEKSKIFDQEIQKHGTSVTDTDNQHILAFHHYLDSLKTKKSTLKKQKKLNAIIKISENCPKYLFFNRMPKEQDELFIIDKNIFRNLVLFHRVQTKTFTDSTLKSSKKKK